MDGGVAAAGPDEAEPDQAGPDGAMAAAGNGAGDGAAGNAVEAAGGGSGGADGRTDGWMNSRSLQQRRMAEQAPQILQQRQMTERAHRTLQQRQKTAEWVPWTLQQNRLLKRPLGPSSRNRCRTSRCGVMKNQQNHCLAPIKCRRLQHMVLPSLVWIIKESLQPVSSFQSYAGNKFGPLAAALVVV